MSRDVEPGVAGRFRLTDAEREFLAQARRAVLCTIGPDGSPRPVPVCFVLVDDEGAIGGTAPLIYTPLDEKPKQVGDPHLLARVRDIRARPEVTILVDRWDEDWDRLAWLRLDGTASVLEPEAGQGSKHGAAVAALRERYAQYRSHDLSRRPMIRVALTGGRFWSAAAGGTHATLPSSTSESGVGSAVAEDVTGLGGAGR